MISEFQELPPSLVIHTNTHMVPREHPFACLDLKSKEATNYTATPNGMEEFMPPHALQAADQDPSFVEHGLLCSNLAEMVIKKKLVEY